MLDVIPVYSLFSKLASSFCNCYSQLIALFAPPKIG